MITGYACDKQLDIVIGFASDADAGRLQGHLFAFSGAVGKRKFHDLGSPYKLAWASGPAGMTFRSPALISSTHSASRSM